MNNNNLKLHYNGTENDLVIINKYNGSKSLILATEYGFENDTSDKMYKEVMGKSNMESKIETINVIHSIEIIFHMDLIKNNRKLNVSPKYPLIFVHIPKTAGQSVNDALSINNERIGHRDLRQLQYSLNSDVYTNNTKFGIIRNPFDRIVSLYSYKCNNKDRWAVYGIPEEERKTTSFEEWFWNVRVHINMLTSPHLQFKSCYDCLIDNTGELGVDYTLRFEHLEEDWNNMAEVLDLKVPKLLKKNVSKHKHYSEYFKCPTGELIKKFIYDKFKNDFVHFGYEFEDKT